MEGNKPNAEAFLGVTGGITFEVEIASNDVEAAEPSAGAGMPQTSQYHQHEEHRHHFQ